MSLKYFFEKQNISARQARWLAFLSEFDFEIKHIKGKENKVVDAFCRKIKHIYTISINKYQIDLEDKIKFVVEIDKVYDEINEKGLNNNSNSTDFDFSLSQEGWFLYKNILYTTNLADLDMLMLNEFHKTPFFYHTIYHKMISSLRKEYFYPNMKIEVVYYSARFLESQQVKHEHQHPVGHLYPLPNPKWKWEVFTMYFIIGLPKTRKQRDSIMVVVNKFSKDILFL